MRREERILSIEKHINFKSLKRDLRKVGANLITAGIVGLFITHISGATFLVVCSALWVVIVGAIMSFGGLYRRKKS